MMSHIILFVSVWVTLLSAVVFTYQYAARISRTEWRAWAMLRHDTDYEPELAAA